ncbi:MAG: hypothetical protein ACO29V_07175 [Limnohabitans sp.]
MSHRLPQLHSQFLHELNRLTDAYHEFSDAIDDDEAGCTKTIGLINTLKALRLTVVHSTKA